MNRGYLYMDRSVHDTEWTVVNTLGVTTDFNRDRVLISEVLSSRGLM